MNASKWIKLLLAMVFLATAGIGNVWADRFHGHGSTHFGIMIGPVWDPWYYPAPYYYPPSPPIVIERAPPVYIEQAEVPPAPALQANPGNYWYYCGASKAYYPYVRQCPSGWQRVSPQPPNQP